MSIKVNEEGFKGLGSYVSTLFKIPGGLAGGTIGLGYGIKDAVVTMGKDVATELGNSTVADLVIQDIYSNTESGYLYGVEVGAMVGGVIGDCAEAYGAKPLATLAAGAAGFFAGSLLNKPVVVGALSAVINLASSPDVIITSMIVGGVFTFSSLVMSYCVPKLAPHFLGSYIGGIVNKPLIMGEIGSALTLVTQSDNSVISAAVAGMVFMAPSLAMSYFAPIAAPVLCAGAAAITTCMLVKNHPEFLDFTIE